MVNKNKKIYDHYEVIEEFQNDGLWKGYRCSVIESTGKQGKLFVKTDGRENYQDKKKDEDEGLEI